MEEAIEISHLDHLVLTVADIERTCAFYYKVLGLEIERFGQGRTGATGPLNSVYIRDPDDNLIELANASLPNPSRSR